MRNSLTISCILTLMLSTQSTHGAVTIKPGPSSVPCFDVYEIVIVPDSTPEGNPFTSATISATFTPERGSPIKVDGFCDDRQGRLFRVRFCPSIPDTTYRFSLSTNLSGQREYTGSFKTTAPAAMEPVIVNSENSKHFRFALTGGPFYHMGLTAYHLLDITNDDRQIEELLDYCVHNGFNKVRFLLTGYPRDTDTRSMDEYNIEGDPWKLPNYGAPPGQVNPLPAWEGKPHKYDFTRFNVDYWQKADRAVRAMRSRGIVATCIVTIEKQNLPKEYGALTEHEKRLYRYAVSRLAAFSNVWWDLGNEHIEYRKPDWAGKIGQLVKEWDPYDRLCSAHSYADWNYDNQPWADFIITQQYGTCSEVNQQVLKYLEIPKPYINEEYGYEGKLDKPAHGMNADWVRKCHWSIAVAGGYATYGDWMPGTAFYTGQIGQGLAPAQLRHLCEVFESIPYTQMKPHNELVEEGAFCLAKEGNVYLVYLADSNQTTLHVKPASQGYNMIWIDPRTGKKTEPSTIPGTKVTLRAPSSDDWVVIVKLNM